MKQLYNITIGLLLLACACKKDDSTYAENPIGDLQVSGLQQSYSVYTHQDTLRINPVVKDEALYDFFWTSYSTSFVQNTGLVKSDTLGRTKALNYAMMLNPGQYYLILNARHKATGVIKMAIVNMAVSTLTMNGWYVLKDDGSKTDFDFYYTNGHINNWIAFYNNGRSLDGTAVKAIFVPSFKMTLSSTDLFSTLMVLSDKDAVFCRVDNGKIVKSFDDMFFSKPATRKLQNAFQPSNTGIVGLINDNKVYSMAKGALFADFPPSTYRVSPVASVVARDVGFDENSKSIVCFEGANYVSLGTNGTDLKNMNADIVWMGGYQGTRGVVMPLFRKPSGEGSLFKLNGQYGYIGGTSSPLVLASQTVPASHGLMKAAVRGGSYDADLIYYALDNKIYRTDMATLSEDLQVTLPAGETVTTIQHIKYPSPNTGVVAVLDYLAVASYANGHYKVWLYKISSTGTIQAQDPSFEGEGRVSTVTYMEQGNGSRYY